MVWKAISLSLFMSNPALADCTIAGRVTVVGDVDTVVFVGTPVLLHGMDGPERSTAIGREAQRFMTRLVRVATVTCQLNGERTYDRWVGVCYLDRLDIGAIAVSNGHALDCRHYPTARYSHLETPAARSLIRRAGSASVGIA